MGVRPASEGRGRPRRASGGPPTLSGPVGTVTSAGPPRPAEGYGGPVPTLPSRAGGPGGRPLPGRGAGGRRHSGGRAVAAGTRAQRLRRQASCRRVPPGPCPGPRAPRAPAHRSGGSRRGERHAGDGSRHTPAADVRRVGWTPGRSPPARHPPRPRSSRPAGPTAPPPHALRPPSPKGSGAFPGASARSGRHSRGPREDAGRRTGRQDAGMGIRMLNHRPAVSQTTVGAEPAAPLPPVPALAAGASTARVPTDLAAPLRRAGTGLRRRLAPREPLPWRLWADLTRGYVALFLARLPRPGPVRTVTVFVAAPPAADRPSGPPQRRPRPDRPPRHPHRPRRGPGRPDATP